MYENEAFDEERVEENLSGDEIFALEPDREPV